MKIAIVSNQIFTDGRVTNPVLARMKNSMMRDERVEEVMLLPVSYSFKGLTSIRTAVKLCDVVHIHGTEHSLGLAYLKAVGNKNAVVSIQGLISVIANYYQLGISCQKDKIYLYLDNDKNLNNIFDLFVLSLL